MKRDNRKDTRRRLGLRRETLRQLHNDQLANVAGGYYWYLPCMGTLGSLYC
jgi:hypothetical protein